MYAGIREKKTKTYIQLILFYFNKFLVQMFKNILKFANIYNTKMVILIRTDTNMGKGKIASQAAHAAVSLYQLSIEGSNPYLKSWLRSGQPKIVLKVESNCEQTLQKVYNNAKNSSLTTCLIRDAGRTQINSGTITAVGIGPGKIEEIDKITSNFKLL